MFSNVKTNVFGFSENLSLKVKEFFDNKPRLDEDGMRELEARLLSSDLGPGLTKKLLSKIKKEEAPLTTLFGELLSILEPRKAPLEIDIANNKPFTILMVGVNGSGKTTTVAKLANLLNQKGHSVTIAAADTFRAAAQEQLTKWAGDLGIPIVIGKEKADPASVVYKGYNQALSSGSEVLIVDTAGRLHTQKGLMDELAKIKRVIDKLSENKSYETLLVVDSTMGRNVVRQAELFAEQIGVTGLVITKLDGTAKGGVILEIAEKFEVGIQFVGTGEKADDLSEFDPKSFTRSLLNIGSDEDVQV